MNLEREKGMEQSSYNDK